VADPENNQPAPRSNDLTNALQCSRFQQAGYSYSYSRCMHYMSNPGSSACVANGLELLHVPLIIGSTGRIDEVLNAFVRKVLRTYSKGNESVHRAYSNYWLSRLSSKLSTKIDCCLDSQQVQAHQC
jgi:hypothetical protein